MIARVQCVDEPAANYVLALKLLASQCGFGTHKDEVVKDKIVFGLRDEELKHKLLMKDNMTLEEVEDLVVRTELAKLRAKECSERDGMIRSVNSVKYRRDEQEVLSGASRPSRVYGSRYRSRSRSLSRERVPGKNYNWHGRRNYREYEPRGLQERRGYGNDNPHANVICNYCKKRGHVKRNCFKLNNRKTVNFV